MTEAPAVHDFRPAPDVCPAVLAAAGFDHPMLDLTEERFRAPDDLLQEILEQHAPTMFRVALSIVRDRSLAEDVVQDSLMKAWQAAGSFRGDSSLRAWALRIAHNTAISMMRKRREELRDPAMLPEDGQSTSLDRHVQSKMMVNELWSALDTLDHLSRTIVVLREVEGFTYEDIADALELPLPTVKTRLFRARKALSAELKDWQ